MMENRDKKLAEMLLEEALAEDLGEGDITTEALISPELKGMAVLIAKEDGILAGLDVALAVFYRVDPSLQFEIIIPERSMIKKGDVLVRIGGSVASILKAERVALNFLQHISGIATETYRYVEAVDGLNVRIMDTRKTIPGYRAIQKYAVRVGGGYNHRLSLGDGILVKDNHLALLRAQGLSMKEIIAKLKQSAPPGFKVEVEADTVEEAVEAAEAGASIVLLDNMSLEDMRRAVELVSSRVLFEASGGITLENVREVAETGVDFISVGALTHSSKALDISLEM